MSDKLYDSVFIASDSKQNKKVRFANDHDKRLYVLQRNNFTIFYSKSFNYKMTKEQILDYLDEHCDIDDQDTVDEARKKLNIQKTSVDDVFKAILERKKTP